MFDFVKNVTKNSIAVMGMATAIVVGFDLGEKLVNRINTKKEQKEETPEIEEMQ